MPNKRDHDALNNQNAHWEATYSDQAEMFGENPSESAKKAAAIFKQEGKTKILELGGGQGRDTLFFAQNGFHVYVLDYSDTGIKEIKSQADALGLSEYITAIRHDAREPLPFDKQKKVLEFVRSLVSPLAIGVTGKELLKFAGTLTDDQACEIKEIIGRD